MISTDAPTLPYRRQPARVAPWIVLAEDDDDFRHLLRVTLEWDGYRVTEAATGAGLMAALACGPRGQRPDLVITDHRMPGMRVTAEPEEPEEPAAPAPDVRDWSGLGVLEQVRLAGWNTPLLLMTGFGTRELVSRAERASVKVLMKPFDIDDLRTAVQWFAPVRRAREPLCRSCGSSEDVEPMDDAGDFGFCADCRALFDEFEPTDPYIDIGELD